MSETLFEFEEGPYKILNYYIEAEDGKVIIELNQGDLGRLPVEDLDTVEKLREALNEAESYLKQRERRQEEL